MNDSKKPEDPVLPFAMKPEDFESAADSVRLPDLSRSTPVRRPPVVEPELFDAVEDDKSSAEHTILMAVAPPSAGSQKPKK